MNKIINRLIVNCVFFLVVLSYFQFFSFIFMPFSFRVLFQVVACVLMFVLIIIKIIYFQEKLIEMNFAVPILFLIIGSIPCYFVAQSFHNQSFIISAFANRLILYYLLYFFVHLYKIQVKYVLRLIIIIGLFSVCLYYLQLKLYPRMIMNINVIEGRATIRLFVGGMICAQAAYFYFLNQFFAKNNTRYLVLSLLTLSIFILQGTRQLIFALIFLTLIYLLFSRRIKSRFLIALIFSLAVVSFFLIFREIFVELTKVSSSQMQNLSGGIRIKAARFYLTNFMPNAWAYIFGNSNSGLGSAYDQQIFLYAFKYGFYTSDIGILGDYVKYGIVFTIAGLVMLIKAICFKISDKYSFLKYYIFSQCFTLITGYGIFGGVDIVMVLSLYIFDVDRAAILFTKNREKNNQDISLKKPIQLP